MNDLVYLYNPAIKPGLSKKFKKWTGPYKVVTRLSDLNYEIVDQQNKKLVHVNRLKANHNPKTWKPKLKQKGTKKLPKKPTSYQEEEKQEDEHYLGRFPLRIENQLQKRTTPDQNPNTLDPNNPQKTCIQFMKLPKPPYQGENYSIHMQNLLLQDRELGLFHKNYSLIYTEN